MCEPQVFGLWAGSSLAKMALDGQAGGPRLGLDASLYPRHLVKFINGALKSLEIKIFD